MYQDLLEKIKNIKSTNTEIKDKAKAKQDKLAKPPHSFGKLEEISIKIAGIQNTLEPYINKKVLLVFASDNGVYEEKVSSSPQSVTLAQTINLTKGLTGAATLCKCYDSNLFVYDVGVKGNTNNGLVIQRKIRESTNNIRYGSAMTKEECLKAIEIGFKAVEDLKDKYDIFGVGEMGIGNTTTSSAILSVLTGIEVKEVTGKGAGLKEEGYLNEIKVIEDAIEINKPNKEDIIDVLSKVGGFDIAAMTGAFLACGYYSKPVVIDGLISVVAALCAYHFDTNITDYLFASHNSYEIGYIKALEAMNLDYLFNLNMRLGEGSGCPIAFEIIRGACFILTNMASFDEAKINDDYLKEIRIGDNFKVNK